MALTVTVVGDAALAARLPPLSPDTDCDGRVVVVGGPVSERVERAGEAVAEGAHAFLLWPPGRVAETEGLAARAEEAGVEVGVARPLGATAALAGVPDGWAARLVTLALVAPLDGPLAAAGWPTLLSGALDVCATLAHAEGAHLDARGERDGDALRAVAFAARFDNGAYAQATVRFSEHAAEREVSLYASRPGSRVEARSLAGPLCVEAEGRRVAAPSVQGVGLSEGGEAPTEAGEVAAFLSALAAGRRAPHGLHRALATLRLADQLQERLR